jgi:hypothetical protein
MVDFMKKKCILIIGFLFLFTSVAFATAIKSNEDYKGTRTYSVTDTESASIFNLSNHYQITTIFSSIYEKGSTSALENFTLQYDTSDYDIISIRPMIKFTVDGKVWEITSSSSSTFTSDGIVQFNWSLPNALVQTLLETKKEVSVRFFYNTSEGDRFRDYTIPYRIITSVQEMYLQKIEPINSVLLK